jgi:hypothetical protein
MLVYCLQTLLFFNTLTWNAHFFWRTSRSSCLEAALTAETAPRILSKTEDFMEKMFGGVRSRPKGGLLTSQIADASLITLFWHISGVTKRVATSEAKSLQRCSRKDDTSVQIFSSKIVNVEKYCCSSYNCDIRR